MATWPSGNKASTTTTDADSDSISGSRVDLNKTVSNVNDIIDMFNIPGSPTDNYILRYNSSTGVFDMEDEQANNAVTDYTNGVDNRIITSTGASTINAESTLLYDGTSLSNTTAPTFTAGSTPIQLNGTQPNQSGYYGHLTVDTGVSRGAYTYNSRTAGGNFDRHIFFFDLDDDFGNRPTGAFQGDHNVWFNANHATSRFDMFVDGFDTAGIQVFGHGGNGYAYQNLELNAADIKHKINGTAIVSIDSDSVDITQDVVITDTEQLKFGTTTTIDKDEITTTGGFTVNVDSDNSSNENFLIQSAGTDVMSFQRGPGGDAEMTVKGDGFFIKDDQDDVQFSMDMSSASQTGINVFRTNENKSLAFSLRTDDDDDTGNFDGTWAFRQDANQKKMVFERTDSSTVSIFEIRDSADVDTADPTDIFEFKIPPVLPSFTVANLPTTVVAGAQAFCTNETGGAVPVFYDGTNWRRCTDRNIAST